MSELDQSNGNQTLEGSGQQGAGGTAASILDAFKGAGGKTGGNADTNTSSKTQAEPKASEAQELKAWGAQLSKELKENKDAVKALSKFEDISGLAGSYLELEKKLGTMTAIPGEKSSKEEIESFYKKLGKPDSFEKYGFKQERDAERQFAQAAFNAHLSDTQAKAMYDFILKTGEGQQKVLKEMIIAKARETDEALKKEFGNLFEKKIGSYTSALKLFGDDEVLKTMEETGLAYNANFVRMFIKIGEALSESKTVIGNGAGGLSAGVKSARDGGTFSFFSS